VTGAFGMTACNSERQPQIAFAGHAGFRDSGGRPGLLIQCSPSKRRRKNVISCCDFRLLRSVESAVSTVSCEGVAQPVTNKEELAASRAAPRLNLPTNCKKSDDRKKPCKSAQNCECHRKKSDVCLPLFWNTHNQNHCPDKG
jgi:hypothetical protein